MKEYRVTVTETLHKEAVIEAENQIEAEGIASERWQKGRRILDPNSYVDVNIEVEDTTPKVEMSYPELTTLFSSVNDKGLPHITGYVVFTENSFDQPYNEEARTYVVSSDNKAFQSGMGGYSIFASCLDGTDPLVRIDLLMRDEYGWKIEKCYMIKDDYDRLIDELAPHVNAPQDKEAR